MNIYNIIDNFYFGSINFDNIGKCSIEIFGDEGNVEPHFHIINSLGESVCDISLINAKYLKKPNKDLTENDINKLINFMMKDSSDNNPKPIKTWIGMCLLWESADGNCDINIPKTMPNYLDLVKG